MKGNIKSEEILIDLAQKGDDEAKAELIKKYQNLIFRAAYRLCDFDREAAMDLTQETFLKFLTELENFQKRASLSTWLYRIMVREFLKERRKASLFRKFVKKIRATDGGFHNALEPSQLGALLHKEAQHKILKAMEKLSDKQKLIVKLKVFQGLKIKEIAEILGIKEGTVKVHLFRGLKLLRNQLSDWAEENG